MVGELLESHRGADADDATPLPVVLATWVGGVAGVPGAPAWSTSSVATLLVTHVRRALKDLRGSDGRIKGMSGAMYQRRIE